MSNRIDKTQCPFCNSAKKTSSSYENTLFNKTEFNYKKCKECKLVYINPFPSNEDFHLMYSSHYHSEIQKNSLNNYESIFKLVKHYNIGNKILDYGCGNGSFVFQALKYGYKATGVEFEANYINKLRNDIKEAEFYSVQDFYKIDEKYDIIYISNVLEHLTNPLEILEKLKTNLEKKGIIIIEGPLEDNFNIALLTRKIFFAIRKIFFPKKITHTPYHIFFSTYKNQELLFDKAGLKKLYYKISENFWPFPSSLNEANTISKTFMYYISLLSINFSKLNSKWGNNFIYVGKLTIL